MTPTNQSNPPSATAKLHARLWILLAALMWSTSGLFAKARVFDEWPDSAGGLLLAFWRAAFAAVVLVPMIRRPKWNFYLLPMTLCFTLMCISYLSAMTQTTAANAIWLQATSPWWVFLLSVSFLHETVAPRDLVPLGFATLGVGTILCFELFVYPEDCTGVFWGLGAGVTYACVVVLIRRLRGHDAAWLIGLNHLVATVAMLPWVICLGIWPSPVQLAVLAGFGIFQMAIPYVLITRALRVISSQEAVAICLIEPVLTPVWVLVWGERPAWWTIAGASLILAGLVLRYVVLERPWQRKEGRPAG